MDVRAELERRIVKERQKISDLQQQISLSESFIQGLQEAVKILPKSSGGKSSTLTSGGKQWHFRSDSDTKKAYELLKQTGQHMNIHEILIGIGKEDNEKNRSSFASSMYRAAKKSGLIKKSGKDFFVPKEGEEVITEEQTGGKTMFDLPHDFGKE